MLVSLDGQETPANDEGQESAGKIRLFETVALGDENLGEGLWRVHNYHLLVRVPENTKKAIVGSLRNPIQSSQYVFGNRRESRFRTIF